MDGYETATPESFGAVLQEMMRAHNRARAGGARWTAATLAARLGVDASLVRRWLRGERVPPARAGRVGRIAEILELSQDERQRLEATHLSALSAQAHGTPLPRDERTTGVDRILDDTASSLPRGPLPDSLRRPLPKTSMAITDPAEVINTCIRLFAYAADHPQDGTTIYQTYNGTGSLAEQEGQRQEWQQALHSALVRGWEVCHLIRLDRGNTERAVQFVDNMLGLLGTEGTYMPYYLTRYGTLPVPYGICLVSGVGAVISFATKQTTYVDAAIYVRDADQLAVLEAHMQRLRSAPVAEPLLETYPRRDDEEERLFLEALRTMEETPGGRFLVKDGLSAITHPLSLYTDPSTDPSLIDLMRTRLDIFDRHVQSHSYRDVCPKRAIHRLVQEGEPAHDDKGLFPRRASIAQRRDWIENVIHLLRRYENYELALLDEAEEPAILRAGPDASRERDSVVEMDMFTKWGTLTEWETFSNQAVLLQWRRSDPHMPHVRITEPTIVRAFESYGETLWSKIKPVNREKEYVVWWLEQQIVALKRQGPADSVAQAPTAAK